MWGQSGWGNGGSGEAAPSIAPPTSFKTLRPVDRAGRRAETSHANKQKIAREIIFNRKILNCDLFDRVIGFDYMKTSFLPNF
jgi:hypothetical protein